MDAAYRAGVTTGEPPGWLRSGSGRRPLRWDWRADVVVAAVAGLVQVGGTALAARHQTDVRPLDAVGVLLLLAGPAALVGRRRWPVPVLGVAFGATLGYVLLDYPGGPIWASLIVAFGTAVAAGRRLVAYASLVTGYGAFLWLPSVVGVEPAPSPWAAVGLAAWLGALLAVSELVRSRRAYRQASRQRALEAERSRQEQARRRASEQRLGIARELHDVLAHSISLINVQAGVALELIDRRPEQVRTALAAIKQASRDALVEVQSVLDALRQAGEPAPRAP
ncbi:MAG TPA: histidine kinase dimerization/phosphoacceptor domain-containing protein, partial [Frankiaceae bacterium]|nr:histidine kinase dimerization/phosphoacceptor domain-containing protein [Frankiaceae bacterium]